MARLRRATTGEGPECPVDSDHGFMLVHMDWEGRYWCPAHSHGGNGRFFTQDEAINYELTEGDEMQIYENTAKNIIDGTATMDEGVRAISKQTKQSSTKVRDRLSTMVDALTTQAAEHDAEQTAIAAGIKAETDKAEAAKPRTPRTPRARKEWIQPEQFAAAKNDAGLSNTAIAKAWGKSPSRMTELTRGTVRVKDGKTIGTAGGSIDVFNEFLAVIESLTEGTTD